MEVYLVIKVGCFKRLYLKDVTTGEDIEYFNKCYNQDIDEEHLMGEKDCWLPYLQNYANNEPVYDMYESDYIMQVIQYADLFKKEIIGCSMITNKQDGSSEILYVHIDEKYRHRGYCYLVSKGIETLYKAGTKLIIRCLPKSIGGQKSAEKLGYSLDKISERGYYYFSKII